MRIGAVLSTEADSKNSMPSSAGVLGVVGSGAVKSTGGRGIRKVVRFAMGDEEEESGKLQVEHFFCFEELTAIRSATRPNPEANRRSVRPKAVPLELLSTSASRGRRLNETIAWMVS